MDDGDVRRADDPTRTGAARRRKASANGTARALVPVALYAAAAEPGRARPLTPTVPEAVSASGWPGTAGPRLRKPWRPEPARAAARPPPELGADPRDIEERRAQDTQPAGAADDVAGSSTRSSRSSTRVT